jgi:AraC-like DNA-binding protein
MSQISARGLLHQLLVEVLRDHDRALVSTGETLPSQPIDRTVAWLTNHLSEEISVNDMARKAGMSVSRFHERFLEELGLTPSEYISWARVLRAKELLSETSSTVSNIGLDLGFSSSQYFATVFKKFVGMSPLKYRAARSSGSPTVERKGDTLSVGRR